jgi:hypothetical protein
VARYFLHQRTLFYRYCHTSVGDSRGGVTLWGGEWVCVCVLILLIHQARPTDRTPRFLMLLSAYYSCYRQDSRPHVYQAAKALHHMGDMIAHSSSSVIIFFIPTLFLHIPYPQPSWAHPPLSASSTPSLEIVPSIFVILFLKTCNSEVQTLFTN